MIYVLFLSVRTEMMESTLNTPPCPEAWKFGKMICMLEALNKLKCYPSQPDCLGSCHRKEVRIKSQNRNVPTVKPSDHHRDHDGDAAAPYRKWAWKQNSSVVFAQTWEGRRTEVGAWLRSLAVGCSSTGSYVETLQGHITVGVKSPPY